MKYRLLIKLVPYLKKEEGFNSNQCWVYIYIYILYSMYILLKKKWFIKNIHHNPPSSVIWLNFN